MPPIGIGAAIVAGSAIAGAGAIAATVIGSQQQKKAQKSAQEFAEQQAAESRAEQQRLEQKYELTPGQLQAEDDLLSQYTRRSKMGGEELLREGGDITRQLGDKISGRLGKTGRDLFLEEGGEAGRQYAERVEKPGASETFAPELELVRQMVNAEANRRGVFGGLPEGGIRFEQLGRAGVDLAIKSARESLAQKSALAQAYINLGQNTRAEAGTYAERGLSASERARAELDQFLSQRRQIGANVALGAANIADRGAERSYNTVSDIYGQQAGEGAALKKQGLDTLGDIAGLTIGGGIDRANDKAFLSEYGDILSKSGLRPGEALSERTGAADVFAIPKRKKLAYEDLR